MSASGVSLVATPIFVAITTRELLLLALVVVGGLGVTWLVLRLVLRETVRASGEVLPRRDELRAEGALDATQPPHGTSGHARAQESTANATVDGGAADAAQHAHGHAAHHHHGSGDGAAHPHHHDATGDWGHSHGHAHDSGSFDSGSSSASGHHAHSD